MPEPALELVVAATFTADPIQPYLDWWGKQFGTRIDVRFAPYNQVFQELLDPDSLLSTTEGAGMLLVRFEDWLLADESSEADQRVKMEHVLSELIEAISAANRRDTPLFAGVLPVTAPASFSSEMISYLEYLNDRWKEELEKLGKLHSIHVIDFRQADRMYAVIERYDAVGDQAAHLPFTPQFNAVMGTFAARHLLAWQGHPFKVIAVDCDNTLWQGVCGEDGCDGVQIQESSRMLQQFLLSKQQEGMLLVLVSKNNEQDVWQVFESHPDMLLSKEHFVAWRLNWQAKSHNLQQLAEEIGVGLDTFVFIDDNELECAEVQARCPEVLTLQLPQERELGPFLEHLWALDRFRVTEEDKQRTSRYITERERLKAKASLPSLQHFLNELKLVVSVNRVRAEQLPRIAQLTQRINQFTLQATRYTEAELYALLNQPDTICWAVEAADRFGSYGLSGAVITRRNKDTLYLDAFLLSCRVLGRGVEQAVLSALKPYFLEEGINYLEAAYMKTGRNVPMLDFLISGSWLHTDEPGETLLFRQKVEDIPDKLKGTTCIYNAPLSSEADPEAMKEKRDSERGRNTVYDTLTELAALEQQANQLEREALVTGWEKQLHRCQLQPLRYAAASRLLQLPLETGGQITRALYCAPDNEIEEALVQIWERILAVKKIGVDDDFFHLGGNSLYAIQVEIEMEKQGLLMESQHLFKYRTIKQLSPFIQVSVMD
ncbi:Plipastatin synthase subunit C [compost metagenome]